MQAQTASAGLHVENRAYDPGMPPHMKRPRPAQGAHIRRLREAAGLTQAELADLVGDTQPNISFWERTNKPPRSDVLPKMAKALGVTVEDLILTDEVVIPHRRPGPVGKLQKTFERAAQLPRAQQERLIELVDTFMRGMQSAR